MRRLFLAFALMFPSTLCAQRVEIARGFPDRGNGSYTQASVSADANIFLRLNGGEFRKYAQAASFMSLQAGARTHTDGLFLEAGLGIACINHTTSTLGTNFEFHTTLATGWTFSHLITSVAYTHFSNARRLFGFREPNIGENFVVGSLGWRF